MTQELAGTRAFITGGGTGIGRASALALAAQGCFVTVAGRTRHTLDETVALINDAGGQAAAVLCDVSDEHQPGDPVKAAARQGPHHFALEVGDLEATVTAAVEAGAVPMIAPQPNSRGTARFAYITDPEGNLIELISPL